MALGRFHPVDVPVLAEVGVAARALAGAMASGSPVPGPAGRGGRALGHLA